MLSRVSDEKTFEKASRLFDEERYIESLKEYKRITDRTYEIRAKLKIGFILYNGLHNGKKETNVEKAIDYYKQVGSHREAQLRLGMHYLISAEKMSAASEEKDEKHNPDDQRKKSVALLKEAKDWFGKASGQGDAEATLLLNRCRSIERQLELDRQRKPEEQEILQKANKLFANGEYAESLKEYEKIAGNDYEIEAKLKAGFILYHGLGDVEQDTYAALAYYKKANNGEAQVRLGIHYLRRGQNLEAEKWLKRAELQGSREGALLLARCHFENGTKKRFDVFQDYDAFAYVVGSIESQKELTFDICFKHYIRSLCRLLVIVYQSEVDVDGNVVAEGLFCNALVKMNNAGNHQMFETRLLLCLLHVYGSRHKKVKQSQVKALSYLEGTVEAFSGVASIVDPAKYLYAKFFSIFLRSKLGKLRSKEVEAELAELAKQQYASPLDDATLLPMGDFELYVPVGVSVVLCQPGPKSVLRESLSAFNKLYGKIYYSVNGSAEPRVILKNTVLKDEVIKQKPASLPLLSRINVVGSIANLAVSSFQRCRNGAKRQYAKINRSYAAQLFMDNDEYERATAIHKELARQGNTFSMGMVGALCYDGEGVPQDMQLALEYLPKAAAAGHAFAQFYWGRHLFRSKSEHVDNIGNAKQWLEKAAAQNHKKARLFLAYMHYTGLKFLIAPPSAEFEQRKLIMQGYIIVANDGIKKNTRAYEEGVCLFTIAPFFHVSLKEQQKLESFAIDYMERVHDQDDADIQFLWAILSLYGSMFGNREQDEAKALAYFEDLLKPERLSQESYKYRLAKFFVLFLKDKSLEGVRLEEKPPIHSKVLQPFGKIEEWAPVEFEHILQKPSGLFKERLRAFVMKYEREVRKRASPVAVRFNKFEHKEQDSGVSDQEPLSRIEGEEKGGMSVRDSLPRADGEEKDSGKQYVSPTPTKKIDKVEGSAVTSHLRRRLAKPGRNKSAWGGMLPRAERVILSVEPKSEVMPRPVKTKAPSTIVFDSDMGDEKKESKASDDLQVQKVRMALLWKKISAAMSFTRVHSARRMSDPENKSITALPVRRMSVPGTKKELKESVEASNLTGVHRVHGISDPGISKEFAKWRERREHQWANEEINLSPKFSDLLISLKLAKRGGKSGLLLSTVFLAVIIKNGYSEFVKCLQLLDGMNQITDLEANLAKIFHAIKSRQLDKPALMTGKQYLGILQYFKLKFDAIVKSAGWEKTLKETSKAATLFNGLRWERNLEICHFLGIGQEYRWAEEKIKYSRNFSNVLRKLDLAAEDKVGLLRLSGCFSDGMSKEKHSEFLVSLQLLDESIDPTFFRKNLFEILNAIGSRKLDKPTELSEDKYRKILGFFIRKFPFVICSADDWRKFTGAYQALVGDRLNGRKNHEICGWLGITDSMQKRMEQEAKGLCSTASMLQRQQFVEPVRDSSCDGGEVKEGDAVPASDYDYDYDYDAVIEDEIPPELRPVNLSGCYFGHDLGYQELVDASWWEQKQYWQFFASQQAQVMVAEGLVAQPSLPQTLAVPSRDR